jgi:hypothetical protein
MHVSDAAALVPCIRCPPGDLGYKPASADESPPTDSHLGGFPSLYGFQGEGGGILGSFLRDEAGISTTQALITGCPTVRRGEPVSAQAGFGRATLESRAYRPAAKPASLGGRVERGW